MNPTSVHKILVISDGEDQTLAFLRLPFIRALKFAFPLATIDWLVAAEASAFDRELWPLVENLVESVEVAPQLAKGLSRWLKPPWQGKKYELSFNFMGGGVNDWLAKMIPAELRITVPETLPNQHPSQQLLELVGRLCGKPSQPNLRIPLKREVSIASGHILRYGYNYIALAPGSESHSTDSEWPLDFYVEIALTQFNNNRIPIFLLLDETPDRFNRLSAAVPTALFPMQHPAAAGWGYDLMIALLQQCWVGLAEDSLYGHLMGAANIPMLSLFSNEKVMTHAPWAERGMVLLASDFAEGQSSRHPLSLIPPVNVLHSLEALIAI